MKNPLERLRIDYWYKATLALASCILILSLTVELKAVGNAAVQLVSLGTVVLSLGEWVNHPLQTRMDPLLRFKVEGHNRQPCLFGWILDCAGLVLLALGIIRLF